MSDAPVHPRKVQIAIAELTALNSLRIFVVPRLRMAEVVYCRRADRFSRWLWGQRIVSVPDHTYTAVNDGYFVSVLNDRLLEIMERAFNEPDRYKRRFLELRMSADLNASLGLLLDYEILIRGSGVHTHLLIPRSPFLRLVKRRYEEKGLEIGWCFSDAAFRESVWTLGAAALKCTRALVTCLRPRKRAFSDKRPEPTVSVYCQRGGDSLRLRNDLVWLDSGRTYPNVLTELGSSQYPFSEAMVGELSERKIRVVETHRRKRTSTRSLRWEPGKIFLSGFTGSVLSLTWRLLTNWNVPLQMRCWRFIQELRFYMFLHSRLDYYRTFNVKVEMKLAMGANEVAHSAALARLGGITVTQQYSASIFFGVVSSTATVHLHFGRRSGATKSPPLSDFDLMNGYVFKGRVRASEDSAQELKSVLARVGVRRSACFFEENPSREFKERFIFPAYRFLMEKVLADPEFGVLIKPKKDSSVAMLEREMGPLFDRACATGRCVVLSWAYYPGVVAQAVDLATGVLGTSTLEAAVMERPTVHLNTRGGPHTFFLGAERNIYGTVEGFTSAIEAFFRLGSTCEIGRHSKNFLEAVDHYGDGLAGERMANIAFGYVSKLKEGFAPQKALDRTMADFDSRWGLCRLQPQ